MNANMKWNEMSAAQKTEVIVTLVMGVITLAFIVLDVTGVWKNNLHYIALSVLSVYECIMSWNKNRKMAILELVAAVFLAASAFLN